MTAPSRWRADPAGRIGTTLIPARRCLTVGLAVGLKVGLAARLGIGSSLGLVCASGWTAGPALATVEPGRIAIQPLLAARLVDLDDRPASVAPRAGRPMVVNFWARWCGPCKAEIPELIALRARAPGVDVVGIALEQNTEAVRDFAHAYDIDYRVLLAREGGLDLMRALGNERAGLPFTVVIDRQGGVVALRTGQLTREHLDAALRLVQR